MLNQVCVIGIKVNDLKKGVAFYTEVLNFKIAEYYGDSIIQLEHNGVPIILEKDDSNNTQGSSKVVLGINSTDIHADFKQLKETGVNMLFSEPQPCPPGYFFVIEDFEGNQIEIVQFVD